MNSDPRFCPSTSRSLFHALGTLLFSALLILAPGRALSGAQPPAKGGRVEEELQWPPKPQEARIKWVAAYSSEFDVGAKKRRGFLERLTGKGQSAMFLKRPLSVAVDDQGTIFVGDFGLGIVVMEPETHKMWRFADVSDRSLKAPAGIAVDSKFVYATDANTNTLAVFDKEGHFVQALSASDGIKRPVGVAVDEAKDLVVVVNAGDNNVLLLNRALKLKKKIGARGGQPGQFNYATFCCIVPGLGFAVCDTGNFRVQLFDYNGKFIRTFGHPGDTSGCMSRPKGVAVDPAGDIYVVDAVFSNFQIFREDGQLLSFVGSGGVGRGEFQIPSGIAIGKDGGIYVADEMNGRIQRFQFFPEKKTEPANKK